MRYDDLLGRLAAALEQGDVQPAQVERLLARRSGRPNAAEILMALGVGVAFAGVALLYAMEFDGLSSTAKLTTPFLFPLSLLGAAVWAARTGRPRWVYETIGLVGQLALAIAFVVVEEALQPSNGKAFGAVCAATALVEVLACHRLIGSVRLTGWGLSASWVGLVFFTCGATDQRLVGTAGILLLEGAAATVVAAVLLARESEWAVAAARTAPLLLYAAAVAGADQAGWDTFSIWHVVIAVAVVTTFLAVAVFQLEALIWVGALGGLIWLAMVSGLVADRGSAGVVVLMGAGLTALGLLVARVRGGDATSPTPHAGG